MKEIVTERPDLFEPNVYITMCVELAEKIDPCQLRAAIEQAYKANEAAMSKIVLEQGVAYYEKQSVSGCSVNSYFVTMFLQRFRKKCEVGIPVSIRESGNESMVNLTSGIRIIHRFDPKKSFAENGVQVHGKIKRKLKNKRKFVLKFLAELPGTLLDAVLLTAHGCYSHRLAEKTAKIMDYIGKISQNVIGVSTFNGKMTFTFHNMVVTA